MLVVHPRVELASPFVIVSRRRDDDTADGVAAKEARDNGRTASCPAVFMGNVVPLNDVALTVVMPVYNAMPYLDEAVASTLAQTFPHFRLAIYDDHSTDGSFDAAQAWSRRDPRVSVVRGPVRLGPTGSSNAAAALAETEFVARMDADDIMHPERLALQLPVLTRMPDVVLVGSPYDPIDAQGRARPELVGRVGNRSPIAHPSILYRRAMFNAIGGYREGTDYFEDVDLYARFAAVGRIVAINRPLITVRFAGQHARLNDDPAVVLRKLDSHYSSNQSLDTTEKLLSPETFYGMANLAMRSMARPRVFRLMFGRMSLAKPGLAALVAAYVGLATLSPRLTHLGWYLASMARNRIRPVKGLDCDAFEWNPVNGDRTALRAIEMAAMPPIITRVAAPRPAPAPRSPLAAMILDRL